MSVQIYDILTYMQILLFFFDFMNFYSKMVLVFHACEKAERMRSGVVLWVEWRAEWMPELMRLHMDFWQNSIQFHSVLPKNCGGNVVAGEKAHRWKPAETECRRTKKRSAISHDKRHALIGGTQKKQIRWADAVFFCVERWGIADCTRCGIICKGEAKRSSWNPCR